MCDQHFPCCYNNKHNESLSIPLHQTYKARHDSSHRTHKPNTHTHTHAQINSITPAGVIPNGQKSKKKFFHFWYQNDSNREKRAKNFFDFFDPKNSITPAGVTPNGQKSPKIFFSFLASEWLNSRKKAKKKLTQNLVLECLECVECGPKKGQDAFFGSSVIHR